MLKVDELDHYFVTVQGSRIDPCYNRVTEAIETRTVDGAYLALQVDDHILLVKADAQTAETTLTGSLTDLSDSLDNEVYRKYRDENPKVAAAVLLDVTGFRLWGTVGLVAMVMTLGRCARNFARAAGARSRARKRPDVTAPATHA